MGRRGDSGDARDAPPRDIRHGSWSAEVTGPDEGTGVVVLIHGGFWRSHYDLTSLRPIAAGLAAAGHLVWNIEYPRVGMPGGGWPGTAEAVAGAVDAALVAAGGRRVVVAGHSAGGHLALWAARGRPVAAVVSLAGVADLVGGAREQLGDGAVPAFLGAGPDDDPERYAAASPLARLPLGVPAVVIHGDGDRNVPISQSRTWVTAARAAGDDVDFVELAGADHFDVIAPAGPAWEALSAATRAS